MGAAVMSSHVLGLYGLVYIWTRLDGLNIIAGLHVGGENRQELTVLGGKVVILVIQLTMQVHSIVT